MSRIGKRPVVVPAGVDVTISGSTVKVKGPMGELSRTFAEGIAFERNGAEINVARQSEAERHKALHGLSRTLLNNMVEGCATGFKKVLEIQGVGYKAEVKGPALALALGFSHPVSYPTPAGVTFTVTNNTVVTIAGADKEKVGQVAAEIRLIRPPEPYKGKGVRYQGEAVRRKAGKTGAK